MPAFPTTRWSLIRASDRAAGDVGAAWGELVRDYRPAIVAYFRRGALARDAEDLAQEFLLRSIRESWWSRADPGVGGFRRFLYALLTRFAAQQRDAAHRRYEQGGADAFDAAGDATPERAFDLDFALCLTRGAWRTLGAEYDADGRGELFAALEPWLAEAPAHGELAALAARLGIAPNTLAVQLKRLRARFQKAVHAALTQLCVDDAQADADLAALRDALASDGAHA
ncbi:RNA polymerase sigma factor [Tahibacter soli]|jgi:DNA-directed RNA polymerase specialized sigma24 family protein|uniref:RNA polymerase sigma-70 factor (ECF subfamily) n=1 Tax=Tahibacter soli TaxID=2983605 RepID=A0A9X3YKG7_9GAMM|nr:hypothetical protein [Tahibacter soli]MDC8012333.1 hypothetical protein [Tahibacter soli]